MEGEIVTGQALVPVQPQPQIIRPLATADEALDAWQAFQALKGKLVTKDDLQHVGGKDRITKSGWRKIAAAFGISTEAIREERRAHEDGNGFVWEVTVRAIAPNGRYADGLGSFDTRERRMAHLEHDARATAFTRACNRAISDLVGGGEVSAEEVSREALSTIDKAQAAALVDKFLAAFLDGKHPMPSERDLLTALVMAHGDLRQAYRLLKSSQPEAAERAPDDEDSE